MNKSLFPKPFCWKKVPVASNKKKEKAKERKFVSIAVKMDKI